MSQARTAGDHAMGAARGISGAARYAAYAAGQAAVAAHDTDAAAAYPIKSVQSAAAKDEREQAGCKECQ
jgi:hypothetical protein